MSDRTGTPVLTRAHLFAAALFALLLILLYQAANILAPFLSGLLWAGVIAIALHPLHERLLQALKGRSGIAAGSMTFAVASLIIIPSVLLLMTLASQSVGLYQGTIELIRSGRAAELWDRAAASSPGALLGLPRAGELDIPGFVAEHVGEISSGVAAGIGGILKNTLFFGANLLVMLIALFFFFRDGGRHCKDVLALLPFTDEQKAGMTGRFLDTFNAVITGVFFIALLQGFLAGIGFMLFGVPYPALWGVLAAFLALLPVGGTALVWIPAALYLFFAGSTLKAVLLAAWGLVFVSLPDNLLKPLVIGKKAKIPTFFLFIAILGGIKAYGFLGILFGPVVVTLLAAAAKIYREEFANK